MPWLRKEGTEVAREGLGPEPRAEDAHLRTQRLTQELLDWAIHALTAVLASDAPHGRPRDALTTALKQADHLYPLTLEDHDRHHSPGHGLAADRSESDSHDRPRNLDGDGGDSAH